MLRKLALGSSTQPLSRPVPGESTDTHLAIVGPRIAGRRAAWRHFTLWLSGQQRFKRSCFPAGARRLLWCYFGENQLGDALMDLSARSLLQELGFETDLFTTPALAGLFQGDPWLGLVSSRATDLAGNDYDCAIVLGNRHRTLRHKTRHFPRLPWVSLHEYFTGPNFHRGLFAAQRLGDLAGWTLDASELQLHGRQKLAPLLDRAPGVRPIALAIGAVHQDRAYPHWEPVVRELVAAGHRRFVLVGSENGLRQAAALRTALAGAHLPPDTQVEDLTGHLSLRQTRAVLHEASVCVCADGGLMHLALTTGAAVVPLFARGIAPEWRLPADCTYTALRSVTDRVADIPSHEVAAMVLHSLSANRR